MHKTLQRQLNKIGLDKDTLPDDLTSWQLFLDRVNTAYMQSDENMYTIKRSSDLATLELESLNDKLSKLASFPEENVGPVLRFTHQGRIEYSNTAGLLILNQWGFSVGETLNNQYLSAINEVFDTQTDLIFEQVVNDTTFSLRFTPIIKSGYVNVYGTDITRLKKIESNLVEARDQAEQANIEKSRFLANMSHELRTPMHGILGFVSLSKKLVDDQKVSAYLTNIETSAVRLTALLNNILDLAKLESGKMYVNFELANLTEITKQCLEQLQPLSHDKNLRLEMNAQKLLQGYFDKALITQVIINLLSNAIRFSPTQGTIDITLEKSNLYINYSNEAVLKLTIRDQGVGIPENELHSIFNKFIQSSATATQAGGTGLGLAICEEIIHAHKGKIWVENNPAKDSEHSAGASFYFVIPINQP